MADLIVTPRRKRRHDFSKTIFKVVLLIPAFVILGIFMFYPIIETFRMSTMRASALGDEEYIGLDHYIRLFGNDDFLAGLLHVFQWAFFSIVIQIPLAFFIAFTCSVYKSRLVKRLRSIYYLGNVIPITIISMLGMFIVMPNSGAIVTFAQQLGWKWLERIDFTGNADLAFWTLFTLATWAYIGFQIVYLMATIDQIPSELYEAAMIDGASKWQYARHIVLPHISFALRILALLCTIGSIKLFELPWLVTVGGPGNATTTLAIVLYKEGFMNWQYGKGAAVGVVIFVLSLVFTILQFSTQRRSAA